MFWDNYDKLCKSVGKSPTSVADELGFTSGSVVGWRKGAAPRNSALKKIADYFGVTIESLLSDDDVADTELQEYLEALRTRPEMKMLFSLAKDATKADVERAVAIIEALKKNG